MRESPPPPPRPSTSTNSEASHSCYVPCGRNPSPPDKAPHSLMDAQTLYTARFHAIHKYIHTVPAPACNSTETTHMLLRYLLDGEKLLEEVEFP